MELSQWKLIFEFEFELFFAPDRGDREEAGVLCVEGGRGGISVLSRGNMFV